MAIKKIANMNENFLNISQLACQKSHMTILENSDRHFIVAEKIYEMKDFYGIAISHLILSTEELVKALIIYLEGEGLHLRSIKGIKSFSAIMRQDISFQIYL